MMTCSILTTFKLSNRIFCAFFNVSSTDNINVEILIESYFFLNAFWRSSFVFLFRLINLVSSLWLEVDKSIVSVFSDRINWFLFAKASSMLYSIWSSIWFWLDWSMIESFEFDWFSVDSFVIICFRLSWSELSMFNDDEFVSLFMLNNFFFYISFNFFK
jgi:hypothetical protein